jgi:phosphoglycolate phosphatase-like HAD superfamily hydrolase
MQYKLALFDWDGTLRDTKMFIHEVNMMILDLYNRPRMSFEEWF